MHTEYKDIHYTTSKIYPIGMDFISAIFSDNTLYYTINAEKLCSPFDKYNMRPEMYWYRAASATHQRKVGWGSFPSFGVVDITIDTLMQPPWASVAVCNKIAVP